MDRPFMVLRDPDAALARKPGRLALLASIDPSSDRCGLRVAPFPRGSDPKGTAASVRGVERDRLFSGHQHGGTRPQPTVRLTQVPNGPPEHWPGGDREVRSALV